MVCSGSCTRYLSPLPSDYLFVAKRRGAAPLHLQASTLQPSPSTWLGRTETRRTQACVCSGLLRLFSVLAPVQCSYACSVCLHPLGVCGLDFGGCGRPGTGRARLSASRLSCFTIGKTYHKQNSERLDVVVFPQAPFFSNGSPCSVSLRALA